MRREQPSLPVPAWLLLAVCAFAIAVAVDWRSEAAVQPAHINVPLATGVVTSYRDVDPFGVMPPHHPAPTGPFRASESPEYQLHQALVGPQSHYLKHIRPLRNTSDAVFVDVGISVNMVEELIERDQTMVMVATIKMKWNDAFLVWDPRNYSGIQVMAIATDLVWLPDITIVNSPENLRLTHKTTHVQVNSMGEVGYYPSGRLMTRCNLHIKYFPFDKQHCEILLESWIYDLSQLQVQPYHANGGETVDVRETYTNHQWAITGHRIQLGITLYDGYNFSSMAFIFLLERKSDYYFMYYVFPQLLLAALQTLSHTLPVEHPGRMTLLTSLFIGTSVTQASVAVHIPKSSDSTSLLQIYMTTNSCNLALSLIVTFFLMYAYIRIPSMCPRQEPSIMAMLNGFFSIVWPPRRLRPSPSRVRLAGRRLDRDESRCPTPSSYSPPADEVARNVQWSTSDDALYHRHNYANTVQNAVLRQPGVAQFVETELSRNVTQRRFDMRAQMPTEPRHGRHRSSLVRRTPSAKLDRSMRHLAFGDVDPLSSLSSSSSNDGDARGVYSDVVHPDYSASQRSNRERRRLKHRWLLYCVALDKTIMYAQAVWHTLVPLYLFAIVPFFAPPPEPHVHVEHED